MTDQQSNNGATMIGGGTHTGFGHFELFHEGVKGVNIDVTGYSADGEPDQVDLDINYGDAALGVALSLEAALAFADDVQTVAEEVRESNP